MAESERLNTALEPGVKAMLVELAGGERKVGAYLSALIRDVYTQQIVRRDVVHDLATSVEELKKEMAGQAATVNTMAATLDWINEQLPAALKVYEAMSDEEKASVTHVGALMPPPPDWLERYKRELLARYETPDEQAGAQEEEEQGDAT